MLTRAHAAGLLGVEGFVVTVEADVGNGLPCLTVVGQASGALVEARERVKSALAHCGHEIKPRKQIVNLAPAERRKDESGIELAVAVALLASHGVVSRESLDGVMFWGELALDGALRPAAGTLVVADCARRNGFHTLAVSAGAAREAALIPGLRVVPVQDLRELVAHLRGERPIAATEPEEPGEVDDPGGLDMADVRGLTAARLAVEVMVAGGHNLLLFGPPGVGKTMLARRAAALFPPLDREAALEVTKIHCVARVRAPSGLHRRPPVRMPHHTVSVAGLLGGGSPPRPGEVSLAHRGLLFLDELPEFPRACLEGMREPLEDAEVTIVRARHAVSFPARFQLMAAMNPCPCGYLGHPDRACTDSPKAVTRYRQRLSGPFLDRMDLVVPVQPASRDRLESAGGGEPSADIRARIAGARGRQEARLAGTGWRTNAEIPAHHGAMDHHCPLMPEARRLLRAVAERHHLSPRAQHRLRRVARTLHDLREPSADLDAPLAPRFVAEATQLRKLPEEAA